VAAAGWGNPSRILLSEDGVTWEDLPDESFLRDGEVERPRQGAGGVGWDGEVFVGIFGGRGYRSTDARTWSRISGDGLPSRYVGGGPGLIFLAGDEGVAKVSHDGGESWFDPEGFDCGERIQRAGAVLGREGELFVAGRAGMGCVSHDMGRSFESAPIGGDVRGVVWTGEEYVAAGRRTTWRSNDGLEWTEETHDVDMGPLAVTDEGTLITVEGNTRFYRQEPGGEWEEATSEGVSDASLWSIVFGYGDPSERCPAE